MEELEVVGMAEWGVESDGKKAGELGRGQMTWGILGMFQIWTLCWKQNISKGFSRRED